jgi:membrane protein YqaA with SNARE-associated domain
MSSYLWLFAASFGAATVLPLYSEIVLVSMLGGALDPALLWTSATLGNTLGAVVNWVIGWKLADHAGARWFPVSEKQLERAGRWFNRYGTWTLLLSWMPVGGDALTFVGGMMRVRLGIFLVLVSIGKGARYAMIIAAYEAIPG